MDAEIKVELSILKSIVKIEEAIEKIKPLKCVSSFWNIS